MSRQVDSGRRSRRVGRGQHVQSFSSVDHIRSALASNALSPGAKGVMYDYEKWRFTPENEQRNPAGIRVKEAADLVHARGLLFLAAPAVDLVPVLAPESDQNATGRHLFEPRSWCTEPAARYADVVDIQAQRFQDDPQRYGSFVRAAAAQARAANPERSSLLAGVSAQPGGRDTSADAILHMRSKSPETSSTGIGSTSLSLGKCLQT